jgi:O-acetyl-ADP-ribose deacetylase (regulator of RNase III)
MDKIRVFISYRSELITQVDGRPVRQRNDAAGIFHSILDRHGDYEPWVDTAGIMAGVAWRPDIFRNLIRSDVVALLIGPGTSESEWVRREVALARALGIGVVPIGFDITETQCRQEMQALEISDLQARPVERITPQRADVLMAELDPQLRGAAARTLADQRLVLKDLWTRQKVRPKKAPDRMSVATFRLASAHGQISLHVSSGDISKVTNIDVLVNSENNYLQMARVFEGHTVSSILRRAGSHTRDGRYHDVIQLELEEQVRKRGRPAHASEVYPTSAGGPLSDLSRLNKARVILHVAAVQAVEAENRVTPYRQPHQVQAAVYNALSEMAALNRVNGVFAPEGTDQRAEQERLADAGKGELRSVIFPIFGTGQGGAATADVIGPMIDGLLVFLNDPDNSALARTLQHVHLCAYTEDDVKVLTDALARRFGQPETP